MTNRIIRLIDCSGYIWVLYESAGVGALRKTRLIKYKRKCHIPQRELCRFTEVGNDTHTLGIRFWVLLQDFLQNTQAYAQLYLKPVRTVIALDR